MAVNLHNLGLLCSQLGQDAEAVVNERDAVTIFREIGRSRELAGALRDLGDALRAWGRDQEAGVAWEEGLAIAGGLQIPEAAEIRERLGKLRSTAAGTVSGVEE